MLQAANNLEFEKAALLRDQIRELKRASDGSVARPVDGAARPVSYGKPKRRASSATARRDSKRVSEPF
jgi:excinuclease ABC subunit B